MSRQQLVESLESYVLDLLDDETTRDFERSLADHPDLAFEASQLQQTLTALGYQEQTMAPQALRDKVLATAASRRSPGLDENRVTGVPGVACYRQVATDVTAVINELHEEEMDLPTVYRVSVGELISHLSGMEAYLGELLAAQRRGDEIGAATDHRDLRDETTSGRRAEVVESWNRNAESLQELLSTWSATEARAEVRIGDLRLSGDAALTARAFELWTHGEDICRATGRSFPLPSPQVLRSMADTAVDLLMPLLGRQRRHTNKTLRLTLTGSGGGSWVRRVPDTRQTAADKPDEFATADTTIVADVVDFCRLVADRIQYEGGFDAYRQGDDALFEDVVALAPLLADFGAGPLPQD